MCWLLQMVQLQKLKLLNFRIFEDNFDARKLNVFDSELLDVKPVDKFFMIN